MPDDVKTLAERLAAATILIVDDSPAMREVIHALLVTMGADQIHEASDGARGLELAATLAPQVIILDWEMPGVDGAAFVRAVRSPGKFPHPDIPIIILAGSGDRAQVVEATLLGANEFLLKPVSLNSLQDRLLAVLTSPRPMVRVGTYYRPAPRKGAAMTQADRSIADRFQVD